jgi:hypothetical protein
LAAKISLIFYLLFINKYMSKGTCAGGGAVYGFGLIGALVYYIQHADSFLAGCIGILEAVVWPAMLVYRFLGY